MSVLQLLLAELEGKKWDALVLTEMWREQSHEIFKTKYGHIWYGSGGVRGRKGVGILMNRRWPVSTFKPVCDRLCCLDLKLQDGSPMSLLGVYMPHALMPDEDVEAVYGSLECALSVARQKGYRVIIAGDFNAQVGTRTDDDDPKIIGDSPMTIRSSRGDALVRWCTF